jgi:hypothetical protein
MGIRTPLFNVTDGTSDIFRSPFGLVTGISCTKMVPYGIIDILRFEVVE